MLFLPFLYIEFLSFSYYLHFSLFILRYNDKKVNKDLQINCIKSSIFKNYFLFFLDLLEKIIKIYKK
jgi:hypothetical protein